MIVLRSRSALALGDQVLASCRVLLLRELLVEISFARCCTTCVSLISFLRRSSRATTRSTSACGAAVLAVGLHGLDVFADECGVEHDVGRDWTDAVRRDDTSGRARKVHRSDAANEYQSPLRWSISYLGVAERRALGIRPVAKPNDCGPARAPSHRAEVGAAASVRSPLIDPERRQVGIQVADRSARRRCIDDERLKVGTVQAEDDSSRDVRQDQDWRDDRCRENDDRGGSTAAAVRDAARRRSCANASPPTRVRRMPDDQRRPGEVIVRGVADRR